MEFIKTNSSYVKRKKHSETNDGTIFERDITTLGGLNLFSSTQTPIYTSGNLIISVDNTVPVKKKIRKGSWVTSPNGDTDVWTLDNLSNLDNGIEDASSSDTAITLKKDYYRLQDFSYYGSLNKMIECSLNNIINNFPGELYAISNNDKGRMVTYTSQDIPEEDEGKVIDINYEDETYTAKFFEYTLGQENRFGTYISSGYVYLVSNPFDLNFHVKNPTAAINDNLDKYFFYGDNKDNYRLILADGTEYQMSALTVTYKTSKIVGELVNIDKEDNTEYLVCKGDYIAQITFCDKKTDEELFSFRAYIGDGNNVYYLTTNDYLDVHLRPLEKVYNEFISGLPIFDTYLLTKKDSTQTDNSFYISTFEIFQDTEQGYIQTLEDFIIPIDSSGWNLDIYSPSFTNAISNLAKISLHYDEKYCDNLYRSMTHESIKNFDWTYTREYQEGDEEDYNIGGTRMSNILHLFGREFDEVKNYIDSIKYINNITYDSRNNLPDYFLTDTAENKGWDVYSITPFNEKEYINFSGKKYNYEANETFNQYFTIDKKSPNYASTLWRGDEKSGFNVTRLFSRADDLVVTPYSPSVVIPYGSFITAMCGSEFEEVKNTDVSKRLLHTNNDTFHRILPYYSNDSYTTLDVNNEFIKRLCLNTPSIFKHKGTIDGIEEILAMFGLKSKRWTESLTKHPQQKTVNGDSGLEKEVYYTPDYEIKEYTTFSNGILDTYNEDKETTWINWYNSTKLMQYNYNGEYEGLPVSYEGVYHSGATSSLKEVDETFINAEDEKYALDYDTLDDNGLSTKYKETFVECGDGMYRQPYGYTITEDEYDTLDDSQKSGYTYLGNYIYPYFNGKIDGNPYYQMNGGWLEKKGFALDKDNNIVLEGDSQDDIAKRSLFTETHSYFRAIDDITGIQDLPISALTTGDIMYVENFKKDYIIFDNYDIYEIKTETLTFDSYDNNGNPTQTQKNYKYFEYVAKPYTTQLGDIEFSETLTFSNPLYPDELQTIQLNELIDDAKVKVFICSEDTWKNTIDAINNGSLNSVDTFDFTFTDGVSEIYARHISYFADTNLDVNKSNYRFFNFKEEDYDNEIEYPYGDDEYTHYFILHDAENGTYYNKTYAWEQLKADDNRYLKINTIIDKMKGNNPHVGHANYDSGYEYIDYFNYLYKHILENDLVNEDCFYDDRYPSHLEIMGKIGFDKIVKTSTDDDNTSRIGYHLFEDTKVHSFCDVISGNTNSFNVDDPNEYYFRNVIGNIGDDNNIKCKYGSKTYGLEDIQRTSDVNYGYEKLYARFGEYIKQETYNTLTDAEKSLYDASVTYFIYDRFVTTTVPNEDFVAKKIKHVFSANTVLYEEEAEEYLKENGIEMVSMYYPFSHEYSINNYNGGLGTHKIYYKRKASFIEEEEYDSIFDNAEKSKYYLYDTKEFGSYLSGVCQINKDYNETNKTYTIMSKTSLPEYSCYGTLYLNSNGTLIGNCYYNYENDTFVFDTAPSYRVSRNAQCRFETYGNYLNLIPNEVEGLNGSIITSGISINNVTDQIINTKRMDIIFYLNHNYDDSDTYRITNFPYDDKTLEKRKYIDDVILPYVEQMLPSNILCRICYKYKKSE